MPAEQNGQAVPQPKTPEQIKADFNRQMRGQMLKASSRQVDLSSLQSSIRDLPNLTIYEPGTVKRLGNASELGGIPVNQTLTEDMPGVYKPSGFWEDPARVARYWNARQAAPPGTPDPPWMDVQRLEVAYNYYKLLNPGKHWTKWLFPSEDDPVRDFVKTIPMPPAEAMRPVEAARWYIPQIEAPEVGPVGDITGTFGVSDDVWSQLPWWQKAIIPLLSSGPTAGAAIGGVAGLTAGPLGAVAGAAIGGSLGYAAQQSPTLAKILNYSDAGAEGIERIGGLLAQLAGSAMDPKRYGELNEILDSLPQAWKAASLTYNAVEVSDFLAIFNRGQQTGSTVWNLGEPEPETLEPGEYGLDALVEARRRLNDVATGRTNQTVEEVMAEMEQRFGFSGQSRDLALHMIVDPLNFAGAFVAKGGSTIAKLAGATTLQTAFDAARAAQKGPTDALKVYGVLLRQQPLEDVAKLPAFSRWLAGVGMDEAGKPYVKLLQKGKEFNLLSPPTWFQLTPVAKAKEIVIHAADNLRLILAGETDPVAMAKYIHSLANTKPIDASNVSLSSWMRSAEGASFPMALRSQTQYLDDMLDTMWIVPQQRRQLLHNIEDTLGLQRGQLLREITDVRASDDWVTALKNRLAMAGPEGQKILAAMNDPAQPLTGGKLLEIADNFKRGDWAYTPDDFKWRAIENTIQRMEDWASKWFDVKPEPLAFRIGQAIKSAQSLFLLGLNPNYAVNNFLNNYVTMIAGGVFGLPNTSRAARGAFWDRFSAGAMPERLGAGVGPAEIGGAELGRIGETIRKAGVAKDGLARAEQAFREMAKKFGFASNLSQTMEQGASAIAYTTGTQQAMRALWQAGRGFEKLPPGTQKMLRSLGIDPDIVHAAVAGGMNMTEIEGNLWRGYANLTLDQAISADTRKLLQDAGIYDSLSGRLANVTDQAGARRAFSDTMTEAQKAIDDQVQQNLAYDTERAYSRVMGEGMQAALEEFDRVWDEWGDHWFSHFDNMESIFRQAERMTTAEARRFKKAEFEKSQADWRRQWEITNSKMLGVTRALGGGEQAGAQLTDDMVRLQSGWAAFYDLRSRLHVNYFAAEEGSLAAEIALRNDLQASLVMDIGPGLPPYDLIRQALNKRYREHLALEAETRTNINGVFSDLFTQQFGDRTAADAWRSGVDDIRRLMSETQYHFRTGEDSYLSGLGQRGQEILNKTAEIMRGKLLWKMDPSERSAAWKRFTDEIYKPLIAEEMTANQTRAGEMWRAAVRSSGQETPTPAVRAPLGEVERHHAPPLHEAAQDAWVNEIVPALRGLEDGYISRMMDVPAGGVVDQIRAGVTRANPGTSAAAIEAEVTRVTRELRSYLGTVDNNLKETKLAALRWGEQGRDMALLNYERRTYADSMANMFFPYQFWYSRSMMNWVLRGIDKPAIFANYARLREFQQNTVERPGFPTRLRKKMGIYLPFLPDWMGEGIYIDPLRQVFPFEQMARPFEELADQQNIQTKKAVTILQDLVSEEEITLEDAQAALDNRSGPLWEKVWAQAYNEIDAEISNPLDFISLLAGPSLPVQIAYNVLTGRSEKIGQLPPTRGIQAITGLLGIGGPAGLNIEGGFRSLVGLPEVDRFYDYRVERMLAGLAATGEVSPRDAEIAVVQQSGPAWEMAQRRVAQMAGWQYIGAPLSLDFFPEGEQEQRGIQQEYKVALANWQAGNDAALTEFFDKYPEYEVQRQVWRDPQERLKRFLISEVWDKWRALPEVHRKQVTSTLGPVFEDSFLSKETRSYDAIDTETLAMWARSMGGVSPGVDGPTLSLSLAPEGVAEAVEGFRNEVNEQFPAIYDIQTLYFSLPDGPARDQFGAQFPQMDQYTRYKNEFLAENPDTIPWLTSEKSELYGLPLEIQHQVYIYRNERDKRYPELNRLQNEYFSKDTAGRRAYRAEHPELVDYWDWRKAYAAAFPQIAPYIISDASLSEAITPARQVGARAYISQLSRETQEQVVAFQVAGRAFGMGARQELRRIWEDAGKPGTFDGWLETFREWD